MEKFTLKNFIDKQPPYTLNGKERKDEEREERRRKQGEKKQEKKEKESKKKGK